MPIRRAQPADTHTIAVLVADALHPLAACEWLVPEPIRRHQVLIDVAEIHVEHALTEGQVWITPDFAAAALWVPYDTDQPSRPDDYEQRLSTVCGPAVQRFRLLDHLAAEHHAVGPHHQHLTVLAVRRDRQRLGLGAQLLVHQQTILDAAGVAACATAADPISLGLYRSCGYVETGPPADLPDGPRVWPMWRSPQPGRRVHARPTRPLT